MNIKEKDIFRSLNEFKVTVQDKLLLNENLIKLLHYNDGDPLSKPIVDNVQDLVEKNIFFYPRVFDETMREEKSFITMSIHSRASRSSTYIDVVLVFNVITHKSLRGLSSGENRIWRISEELNEMFNYSKDDAFLGKCKLNDFNELTLASNYYGLQVTYSFTGFKW